MVKLPVTQGMPPIDPAYLPVRPGSFLMIVEDNDKRPVGIEAVSGVQSIRINLDSVQLKSFAEQILRALQR